jgi:uncharacterized protein YpbB
MIEPFGPMLGSQFVFRFYRDRHSIHVLIIASSFYELWGHAAIIAIDPNIQSQSSLSQSSHQIRNSTSLSISVVWLTVFRLALPSVCMPDFRFENGSHHPARAREATMSKTADRVLGVHGFVIWRLQVHVQNVIDVTALRASTRKDHVTEIVLHGQLRLVFQ